MEKFQKLSREEMKNVTGGQHTLCTLSGGGIYDCGNMIDLDGCRTLCESDYGNKCFGCATFAPNTP